MTHEERVPLPTDKVFEIVEEFVHARSGSINEYIKPVRLTTGMGSYLALSHGNAKKDLKFELQSLSAEQTLLRFDLSFMKDNILQIAALLLTLLIVGGFFMIPFIGFFLGTGFALTYLIFIAYWLSGRGKIREEFWKYLTFKVEAEIRNRDSNKKEKQGRETEEELRGMLERLKEDLMMGKITEQEYKRQKGHIEIDLADLNQGET